MKRFCLMLLAALLLLSGCAQLQRQDARPESSDVQIPAVSW